MTTASAATPTAMLARRYPFKRPSLRLQPDLARDLAPQIVLRLDEIACLLGGLGALGEEADRRKLLGDLRILEDLVELLVHLRDDVGRRLRRRRDGEPADHLGTREGVA